MKPPVPVRAGGGRSVAAGLAAALLALLAAGGCGGGAPAPPVSPAPPSASATYRGVLTATVTGAPVSGATLTAGGVSARSAGGGVFGLTLPPGDHRMTISAPGFVSRTTTIRAPNDAAALDVIPEGGPWKLAFYRELVRDGAGGGALRPLTRWDTEPEFFIDTRPEPTTGDPIPEETVAFVREAIGVTVKLLTDGQFTGERVTATDSPPADGTPGTVVLRWNTAEVAKEAQGAAAFAHRVGGPSNFVVFRHFDETYAIHHEIGHVLGLYHPVGGKHPSHMWFNGELAPPHFTKWDIFHARVLYSRPSGNTDVDVDPPGFVAGLPAASSAADGGTPAPILCSLEGLGSPRPSS